MRVRAVVFDLFGTLVPDIAPGSWADSNAEIAALFGTTGKALGDAWRPTFMQRMTGEMKDDDRVFQSALDALGITADDQTHRQAVQTREAFMLRCLTPKPDAIECLAALKGAGIKLGLATDCSSNTPHLLDRTPLGAFLPVRAASAHLGVTKPDPRMYQFVLDGLGVEARDCVYVGDGNSEELPGAKRLGFTTVWVDNGADQHHRRSFVPEGDHTVRALAEIPALVAGL